MFRAFNKIKIKREGEYKTMSEVESSCEYKNELSIKGRLSNFTKGVLNCVPTAMLKNVNPTSAQSLLHSSITEIKNIFAHFNQHTVETRQESCASQADDNCCNALPNSFVDIIENISTYCNQHFMENHCTDCSALQGLQKVATRGGLLTYHACIQGARLYNEDMAFSYHSSVFDDSCTTKHSMHSIGALDGHGGIRATAILQGLASIMLDNQKRKKNGYVEICPDNAEHKLSCFHEIANSILKDE